MHRRRRLLPRFRNVNGKHLAALACLLVFAAPVPRTAALIIGDDGRRSLHPDETRHYAAIGLVVVRNRKGVFGGTGTLVNDPYTVVTAFHNVFHDGATGPIGQVMAPMRNMQFGIGEGDALTYYPVRSIRPFNRNYGFVLADENDLAIVTLREPVRGVEPLRLQALDRHEDGTGLSGVTLVAYQGYSKNIQACSFRERSGIYPRSPDVLVHDCDSEGNASGSPFLDANGNIVAIHLGGNPRNRKLPGTPFNARTNFNVARRVTADVTQFVDGASL